MVHHHRVISNLILSTAARYGSARYFLDGYKSLFADDGVMRGYVNTLTYHRRTLINLAVTLPAAYALSCRDL
ncbi:MAG: hypothetical protein ACLSBB_11430 [Ruthenibacterium lactatiformans]